jgi:hypothetical protein
MVEESIDKAFFFSVHARGSTGGLWLRKNVPSVSQDWGTSILNAEHHTPEK